MSPSAGATRLGTLAERALEAVMGAFLLAMALVTVVDVVGRYLFDAPLPGGYEIVQYLMGLSVFAALPLVTRAESHLEVSLLTRRLRGRTLWVQRLLVRLVSLVALVVIAWRMVAQAGVLARTGAASGSLRVPLAPIGWAMAALAVLAALVLASMIAAQLAGRDAARAPATDPGGE